MSTVLVRLGALIERVRSLDSVSNESYLAEIADELATLRASLAQQEEGKPVAEQVHHPMVDSVEKIVSEMRERLHKKAFYQDVADPQLEDWIDRLTTLATEASRPVPRVTPEMVAEQHRVLDRIEQIDARRAARCAAASEGESNV